VIGIRASKAWSFTLKDEEDTKGFMISVQVGPLVFEVWITKRQRRA
jgi:hypothetical protein